MFPACAFVVAIVGMALSAAHADSAESPEGHLDQSSARAALDCPESKQRKAIMNVVGGLPYDPRPRSQIVRCELHKLLPEHPDQQRYLIQSLSQPGFVPPGSLELRAGITTTDNCNRFGSQGRLKPDARVQSKGHQFWSVQLASGQDRGLSEVSFFQTIMLCPNHPKVERHVWLPGSPVVVSQRGGQSLVVDLPQGWILQWRPLGLETWATAVPLRE